MPSLDRDAVRTAIDEIREQCARLETIAEPLSVAKPLSLLDEDLLKQAALKLEAAAHALCESLKRRA